MKLQIVYPVLECNIAVCSLTVDPLIRTYISIDGLIETNNIFSILWAHNGSIIRARYLEGQHFIRHYRTDLKRKDERTL